MRGRRFTKMFVTSHGIAYGAYQAVQIRRFLKVVERSFFKAIHSSVYIAVSGKHDKRQFRAHVPRTGEHFHAVRSWHFYIAQHERQFLRRTYHIERLRAVFRFQKRIIRKRARQHPGKGAPYGLFILDYQYDCHNSIFFSFRIFSII